MNNTDHVMILHKHKHDDVSIAGMTGLTVEEVQKIIYQNDRAVQTKALNEIRWARATQDDAMKAHAMVMTLMVDPNVDERVRLTAAIHIKDEFHGRLNRDEANKGENAHDTFYAFLKERNKSLEIRIVDNAIPA